MRNFTIEKVEQLYNKVKTLANESMRKGKWNDALNRIDLAARIAYTYNHNYMDVECEELLNTLSKNIISEPIDFIPIENRFVFYDSTGSSNRGLVHQYIRALISWDVDFLYMLGSYNPVEAKILLNEIESFPKAEIFILDSSISKERQIKSVYQKLENYKPQKALLYLTPWDVVALTSFNASTQITKYQINLTDHAFWLGAKCIDYSLEFREFGCTISEQKRGIHKDKLLLQPFYPIIIPSKFMGLPKEVTSEKVIIFSGGAYYKIYGDNDRFFYILKQILDENPTAIILFAGWGDDKPIKRFILKNKVENRLLLLGFRRDINELVEACDIYLGTYPMSGGLMSQYAAVNGKPIISYTSPSRPGEYIESIVCHNIKTKITLTYSNLDDFFVNVKKMIDDKDHRKHYSDILKEAVILPNEFNASLYQLVTTNINNRIINKQVIDYEILKKHGLVTENIYKSNLGIYFWKNLNILSLWFFPIFMIKHFPTFLPILKRKMIIFKNKISLNPIFSK